MEEVTGRVWQLLMPIPMPWRFVLITGGTIVIVYQLLRRALPLVLLPEFWITTRLRRWGLSPLPGTYVVGDIVIFFIRVLHRATWMTLAVVGIGILAWYMRPSLAETQIGQYIDWGIAQWDELETNIILPEDGQSSQRPPAIRSWPAVESEGDVFSPSNTRPSDRQSTPSIDEGLDHSVYVVREGDTLFDIARDHGISVETLVEFNADRYPTLKSDNRFLTVGWELWIPTGEAGR